MGPTSCRKAESFLGKTLGLADNPSFRDRLGPLTVEDISLGTLLRRGVPRYLRGSITATMGSKQWGKCWRQCYVIICPLPVERASFLSCAEAMST